MLVGCATLFLEAGSKGVLDKIKTQFDVVRSEMTQMKHENHLRDHMTAFLDISRRASASDAASKDFSAPTEPSTNAM
ncbi:hypothetical protein L596_026035 [Steinernema carpocapsae]|uniref:Uncharacterized protein n=1 Tax=Steinernema carpocapsae TaxID=34508 RepID=A0A4U5M045_STECR|nr:hypothetical protein L596_026035 [Steinernema carpocapsae]